MPGPVRPERAVAAPGAPPRHGSGVGSPSARAVLAPSVQGGRRDLDVEPHERSGDVPVVDMRFHALSVRCHADIVGLLPRRPQGLVRETHSHAAVRASSHADEACGCCSACDRFRSCRRPTPGVPSFEQLHLGDLRSSRPTPRPAAGRDESGRRPSASGWLGGPVDARPQPRGVSGCRPRATPAQESNSIWNCGQYPCPDGTTSGTSGSTWPSSAIARPTTTLTTSAHKRHSAQRRPWRRRSMSCSAWPIGGRPPPETLRRGGGRQGSPDQRTHMPVVSMGQRNTS